MIGIGLGSVVAQLAAQREAEAAYTDATPQSRVAAAPATTSAEPGPCILVVDQGTGFHVEPPMMYYEFCDPAAVALLKRFDRVAPFGTLNLDDFQIATAPGTPPQYDRAHLRGLVGAAAVPDTFDAATMGQQRAVTELLDWSLEVARVAQAAGAWIINSIPNDDAAVLSIAAATYNGAMRDALDPDGALPALTAAYLEDLSARGLSIYVRLGGQRDPNDLVLGTDCNEIQEMTYDEDGVPEAIRSVARAAAMQWSGAAELLRHVATIACVTRDSDGAWEACGGDDEIDVGFDDVRWLAGIYPDREVSFLVKSEPTDGGACFTERAVLRTADGGTISFAELAAIEAAGQTLPPVAAYDPEGRGIVYQTPRLIRHGLVPSDLLALAVTDAAGATGTLETTSLHRLRVRRGDTERWVSAGALHEGDALINPDGSAYVVSLAGSMSMEGSYQLFNLSFGASAFHNYLVSSDNGQHWFVAHNYK